MEPTYYPEEKASFWSSFKGKAIEFIEFIAIIGAVFVVLRFFVAEPHKVSGRSMVPNFQDGDYIITNKISARTSEFKRGEVVILQNPRNTDQVFIKRVIGLPGERISLLNGAVLINGQPITETYLPRGTKTPGESFLSDGEEVVIPEGQFFVIGDNRTGSSDSREWGPVSAKLIIGTAFLRYWPPQEFTLFKTGTSSQ